MANNPLTYDSPTEGAVNNWCANLNSGFMNIYTGSQPAVNGSLTGTLLVSLPLGATAFGNATAAGGTVTATANAITTATAGNTGTAGYFALLKSDGVTVIATGTVGTSGCDLNLATTSITSGQNVPITSFTVTMPE